MRIYYFGCRRSAGHYFWLPNHGQKLRLDDDPFPHPDQRGLPYSPSKDRAEGKAKLTYVDDDTETQVCWTVLGWRDYSIDSRPGSHSNLIAEGQHTFDEMLAIGREHFPEVMKRQRKVIDIAFGEDTAPSWRK